MCSLMYVLLHTADLQPLRTLIAAAVSGRLKYGLMLKLFLNPTDISVDKRKEEGGGGPKRINFSYAPCIQGI
jgi:hypothetical protein